MPEETTVPPPSQPSTTPQAPDPIEETKRTLNALVARIYDSQKKAGFFLTDEVGEVMVEDFTEFFADLHLKISGAYEAYRHSDLDEESGVPVMLADVAVICLGLCKRLGHDVGKLVLDLVVRQAQEAVELEKQRVSEEHDQEGSEDFGLGAALEAALEETEGEGETR